MLKWVNINICIWSSISTVTNNYLLETFKGFMFTEFKQIIFSIFFVNPLESVTNIFFIGIHHCILCEIFHLPLQCIGAFIELFTNRFTFKCSESQNWFHRLPEILFSDQIFCSESHKQLLFIQWDWNDVPKSN